MIDLGNSVDNSQRSRIGKEYNELAKTMELYEQRKYHLDSIQQLTLLEEENAK